MKSGFEFSVTKQFNEQTISKTQHVDIKNCWELGRLQHLPQLAFQAFQSERKNEQSN